ncbi:hypothetical protein AAE02nite_02640 [Adhaeribacter aerolatus]|uniref:Peptidase M56 domain-containing protein n=1 Tax=Adhaeribacter aerolatus TaxID=670289 RepID=A0A512ASC4_9BACT|nr:M56 family metallopeptidase [Adhaeribacter aerolatus]GEO02600.1 hypothetical protein AAE02nite_02640 [Adhaeribacter aerolatus]
MNYIPEFLNPALTKALGWTILHSLWQSTLIAVLLSIVMLLLHRQSSHLRYRVAMGALFLNLAAALVTFIYYYQSSPIKAGLTAVIVPATASFSEPPIVSAEANGFWLLAGAADYFSAHLPLLVSLWLLGMALMLLRFIGGLAYLQRLKSYKTTPVTDQWQNRLLQLSQELKINKAIRLTESALVQTPLVIGFFKPVILLPLGTISDLPLAQIEAILAHELAHLKRNDYFFNLLQSLTEIIFFYHPAIWWVSDYVRIERENCCDDLAVAVCGDSLAYARALATLAERTAGAPGLSLAFAGKDGSLLARIRRLVQQPGTRPSFTDGFVAATALLLCLTFLSATALANLNPRLKSTLPAAPVHSVNVPVHPVISVTAQYPPVAVNSKAIPDTVPTSSDLVIIKNKRGKVTDVFVDGQQVPKDKLPDYANRIEQALENQQKGKRMIANDTETLRKADAAVSRLNQPELAPVMPPPAPPVPVNPVIPPKPAAPMLPVKPVKPAKPAKPAVVPKAPKDAAVPGKGFFFDGNFPGGDSVFTQIEFNLNFDSTFKVLEKTMKVQEEQFRKQELVLQKQLASLQHKQHSLLQENMAKEHAKLAAEHAKLSKTHGAAMEKLISDLKKEGLYQEGKNRQIIINSEGLFIDGKK